MIRQSVAYVLPVSDPTLLAAYKSQADSLWPLAGKKQR